MTRLMIPMGVLVATLSACGLPEPGLLAEEEEIDEDRDVHYR